MATVWASSLEAAEPCDQLSCRPVTCSGAGIAKRATTIFGSPDGRSEARFGGGSMEARPQISFAEERIFRRNSGERERRIEPVRISLDRPALPAGRLVRADFAGGVAFQGRGRYGPRFTANQGYLSCGALARKIIRNQPGGVAGQNSRFFRTIDTAFPPGALAQKLEVRALQGDGG